MLKKTIEYSLEASGEGPITVKVHHSDNAGDLILMEIPDEIPVYFTIDEADDLITALAGAIEDAKEISNGRGNEDGDNGSEDEGSSAEGS